MKTAEEAAEDHREGVPHRFRSVECEAAGSTLGELLQQVAGGCGRVRITGTGIECVLISAAELQSLDDALSILFGTEGADRMHRQLADLAAHAGLSDHPAFQSARPFEA